MTNLFFFLLGLFVAIVFSWVVYTNYSTAWKIEYRRLMAGILKARQEVLDLNKTRYSISNDLKKLYAGDN